MRWKQTEYTGWGRVHQAEGERARPERASTLQALQDKNAAPAIGQRRSYGDACLNAGHRAIDMTRLDRVLSFDNESGLLDVEAGARLGELARILAPRG